MIFSVEKFLDDACLHDGNGGQADDGEDFKEEADDIHIGDDDNEEHEVGYDDVDDDDVDCVDDDDGDDDVDCVDDNDHDDQPEQPRAQQQVM